MSSHKKRRELNRAMREFGIERARLQSEQQCKTLAEIAESLIAKKLEETMKELAAEREKVKEWKHEFQAAYGRGTEAEIALAAEREKVVQLEHARDVLHGSYVKHLDELTAAQATIAQMRKAMEEAIPALPKQHPAQTLAEKLVALPANLDQLHEDRARECERLADRYDLGFKIGSYLREEATAHRARKEGK